MRLGRRKLGSVALQIKLINGLIKPEESGFFCWEHFERLSTMSNSQEMQFHDAEERRGDLVSHEQLGQLLLMQARMAATLVRGVGDHHDPGTVPDGLMALVHVADNLCKELGLGYGVDERGLNQESIVELRQQLEGETVAEIMEVVERCTSN